MSNAGCFGRPSAVSHAGQLVDPGDRGEDEVGDALELLGTAGMTVRWLCLEEWRITVNTPADIERAEQKRQPCGRLQTIPCPAVR